ncbi:PREDICTED: uncharacterized protein LOC103605040 [Galeopterus variegatus]|uniref:Uncharacterized protein LOC103605040 n=1 Tax=Galeopterus variegatus TaxID=482537 RepID=A0ABM0S4Q3_GALVR|nr:PREDICTED: uncharacterized protein LOC103605040 [Galeopterus variegatus]
MTVNVVLGTKKRPGELPQPVCTAELESASKAMVSGKYKHDAASELRKGGPYRASDPGPEKKPDDMCTSILGSSIAGHVDSELLHGPHSLQHDPPFPDAYYFLVVLEMEQDNESTAHCVAQPIRHYLMLLNMAIPSLSDGNTFAIKDSFSLHLTGFWFSSQRSVIRPLTTHGEGPEDTACSSQLSCKASRHHKADEHCRCWNADALVHSPVKGEQLPQGAQQQPRRSGPDGRKLENEQELVTSTSNNEKTSDKPKWKDVLQHTEQYSSECQSHEKQGKTEKLSKIKGDYRDRTIE